MNLSTRSTAVASASSSGTGLSTLLTVLFVALKLTGVINWSWWWVLAPTWIPIAFILGIILVFLIGAAVIAATTGTFNLFRK